MEVIRLNNVSFKYDSDDWVLKDVNLCVNKKDFIGIVGPNGGGKTTLLKIIIGLLKPNRGEVFKNGSASYVPQHLNFDKYQPTSVEAVVLMGLLDKMHAGIIYSKNNYDQAHNVMNTLGVYDIRHKRFGELSGGQRQRVLIARAIINNPEILILDEPTANIDKAAQETVQKLLLEFNKVMTILMVSHHFDFISSDVNRVLCVDKTICAHPTHQIAGEHISIIDHSGDVKNE